MKIEYNRVSQVSGELLSLSSSRAVGKGKGTGTAADPRNEKLIEFALPKEKTTDSFTNTENVCIAQKIRAVCCAEWNRRQV